MSERELLFIGPNEYRLVITPDRQVGLWLDYRLDIDHRPGVEMRLVLQLTPAESRSIAEALLRTAASAEAMPPPSLQ